MTDRYKRIRAALADMDAAAEARNALAWRDAHDRFVAHVAPDTIRALLEERDALQAENERLHEQLRLAMRDAAPAVQGEPVAYISQEDFEFLLSDERSGPHGTLQAPVFSRKDYRASVPLYASPQPPAQDVSALVEALEELITRIADTYRHLGFDPEAPMRALERARAALGRGG